jgi:hypothetical protein
MHPSVGTKQRRPFDRVADLHHQCALAQALQMVYGQPCPVLHPGGIQLEIEAEKDRWRPRWSGDHQPTDRSCPVLMRCIDDGGPKNAKRPLTIARACSVLKDCGMMQKVQVRPSGWFLS